MEEKKPGKRRLPAGPESEAVAATIRALRATSRMTQEELAERAGLNRWAIIKLESGKEQIQLQQLIKIGRVFGLTASELAARSGV